MKTYQITKVFFVEANSKEEAVAIVTANPGELLEEVFVTEQYQPKPKPASGWTKTLTKQLTGK